jgi:hypothetical protein
MDDCVKLLKGSSDIKTLVSTDRFKDAFAKLPPAEDKVFFFDLNNMLGRLKGMMGQMAGHGPGKAKAAKAKAGKKPKAEEDEDNDDEDAKPAQKKPAKAKKKPAKPDEEDEEGDDEDSGDEAILALIPKLFDEVSIFDFVAAVEWTEGHSVHKESLCAMRSDAKGKTLYDAMTGSKPVTNYEKMIPKEAKSFSLSSGLNWSRLYRGSREFYAENFPGAKKNLEKFDRMQKEEWDLDLDKDIFSLLGGGYVGIEMGDDHVIMIKVSDEEKAGALFKRLVDFVTERAGKENGLMITPTEIAGHKSFYQISHPMMMMMGGGLTPVCGCADGYFIISTNSKALKTCLETAKGDHANISKNEQFRSQSVMPKSGAVTAISFEDQSGMAEQIQKAIGGVSMAMGMVGMFAQDMPEGAKTFFNKLPPIIAKLGPVAGKLDFFVSTGSYTTLENGVWHTREVQNYKGPRPAGEEEETKVESAEKPAKKKTSVTAPKKKPKPKSDGDE